MTANLIQLKDSAEELVAQQEQSNKRPRLEEVGAPAASTGFGNALSPPPFQVPDKT